MADAASGQSEVGIPSFGILSLGAVDNIFLYIYIYARLCHAIPCPALPCHAMPCPALPCPALPCPALPCPALPCYAMLCYAMLCYAMLGFAMLSSTLLYSTLLYYTGPMSGIQEPAQGLSKAGKLQFWGDSPRAISGRTANHLRAPEP